MFGEEILIAVDVCFLLKNSLGKKQFNKSQQELRSHVQAEIPRLLQEE